MEHTEYIVVSDTNSKVLFSTTDRKSAKLVAKRIRQAGGECTIFKSIKGKNHEHPNL